MKKLEILLDGKKHFINLHEYYDMKNFIEKKTIETLNKKLWPNKKAQ